MSKTLAAINIILCIADALICALAICCFTFAAYHFGNWWIILFSFLPLAMFNQHGLIVKADIEQAREDNLKAEENYGAFR